jgi:hypothetical protein
MRLIAVFESWHVPDGNYAPFDLRQRARLSFELDGGELQASAARASTFVSNDDATCEFNGVVLGRYGGLTALEAGGFRFYVNGNEANAFEPGSWVRGIGTLALDHYAWFEGVRSFANPPNLFFETLVVRIRKFRIPERFIHRHAEGKAMPTTVAAEDCSADDIEDLDTMNGQAFDEEFYLLDFDVPAIADGGRSTTA